MPEQKRSGRAKGVPHHPLVEALAPDPNQPAKPATRLFGYPGPAADRSSTRLWLDLELTSYVDVPDEAILHSRTLPDDEGTILWVDPAATLSHSPQPQEVQAEFLAGSIAEGNLAAAPGVIGFHPPPVTRGTAGLCARSQIMVCASVDTRCVETVFPKCLVVRPADPPGVEAFHGWPPHSVGIVCQSVAAFCPTEPPICGPLHSRAACVSRTPELCPVVSGFGAACPQEPWTTPVIDQLGPFRPRQ